MTRSWTWMAVLLAALTWSVTGCPDGGDDDDAVDDDDDAVDDDTADDDDSASEDEVDPEVVIGLSYWLDFVGGGFEYTEPTASAGTILGMFMPEDQGVVFSPQSFDDGAGTVELLIGSMLVTNYEGNEDDPSVWEWAQTDSPTTITTGSWANPAFSGGPTNLEMAAGGTTAWLGDVVFSGQFVADGSEVADVSLEALVDMVPFDEMLGMNPGDLCAMLESMSQIPCETCPPESPDQGDYCLFLAAHSGTCALVEGLTLVEVQ